MFDEKKFEFDIASIKRELEIEDMYITEEDVNLLKRYMDDEINMPELIEIIKNQPIEN